ncbi:SAGA-associated factor 11 [Plasmodiophora brassicae]
MDGVDDAASSSSVKAKDLEIARLQARLATATALQSLLNVIDFDTIVKDLFDSIVEEVAVDVCFDVHRAAKSTGKCEPAVFNASDGVDVFGQQGSKLLAAAFQCANCQRTISSQKYAFHTRRCPGRR